MGVPAQDRLALCLPQQHQELRFNIQTSAIMLAAECVASAGQLMQRECLMHMV